MKTYMLIKKPGNVSWRDVDKQAAAFSIIFGQKLECVCNYMSVSKQATIYEVWKSNYEVSALLHYRNYIKGAKFSPIWACAVEVDTDRYIIKSLGNAYCGIMDGSNFEQIRQFVVNKLRLNSLIKIERIISNLRNLDKGECHNIALFARARVDEIDLEFANLPQNLIKRGF